jgi:hypothetical protein
LNLTRRGEKARQLDLIFPFFATGVEATRKAKRMVTNGRGAVKILGALIAYGVVESMINSAVSGDDDDDGEQNYLDQNNVLRMGRIILYYGEGADEYVKIPIDPILGYFKFVGNRIGDLMLGNATPGDVTGDLFFGAASVASPVRVPQADAPSAAVAFTPLVGKPFMENLLNQNFFGGPIYKESQFDNAPRSELGRPSTSDNWKWLARTMNDITGGSEAVKSGLDFQPEAWRHLIEGYLGGPYQLAKQLTGLSDAEGVADIPGIKSFVGSGSEYAPQTKYFENSSTIRQIMNRLGKLTPEQRAAQGAEFTMDTDPRIIEAYQIVDKELDRVGKEQTEVLALPDITDEDKRQSHQIMAEGKMPPAKAVTSGALINLEAVLSEWDHEVLDATRKLRNYVTNKLIMESTDPDPKQRMRALENLGKLSNVGLFAERVDVNVTHRTVTDIETELRKTLELYGGDVVDVVAKEKGHLPSIGDMDLDEELGLSSGSEPTT